MGGPHPDCRPGGRPHEWFARVWRKGRGVSSSDSQPLTNLRALPILHQEGQWGLELVATDRANNSYDTGVLSVWVWSTPPNITVSSGPSR